MTQNHLQLEVARLITEKSDISTDLPLLTISRNTARGIDMKTIELTQGKVAIVDDEDFEQVNQYSWHLSRGNGGFYASRGTGKRPKRSTQGMHRFLMNPRKNQQVDHINHNGLDNRRANLRLCSAMQNKQNGKSHGGSSKYKGVTWDKSSRKWRASIQSNYKTYKLGSYDDEIDAAMAYDHSANELFGEFANPNFKRTGDIK